jgi:uncharacterized Zn finger protein (UPF0148 family)
VFDLHAGKGKMMCQEGEPALMRAQVQKKLEAKIRAAAEAATLEKYRTELEAVIRAALTEFCRPVRSPALPQLLQVGCMSDVHAKTGKLMCPEGEQAFIRAQVEKELEAKVRAAVEAATLEKYRPELEAKIRAALEEALVVAMRLSAVERKEAVGPTSCARQTRVRRRG